MRPITLWTATSTLASAPTRTRPRFGHPRWTWGSARAFDELAMRAPNSPNDYARGYDVLVSTNDISWTIVAACTGTANPEIVSFPTQTRPVGQGGPDRREHHQLVVDRRVRPLQQRSRPPTTTRTTTTTTTPTVAPTTTSLTSSANPATAGQAVTYTAQVVPAPNGGTVNFFDNGSPIAGCDKVARQHHDR